MQSGMDSPCAAGKDRTMSARARRVLMLAYFFPPLGGAGVQRTLKHVKYLPEQGWEPVVVTTDSLAYPVTDGTLAAEIPAGTRVIRAHELKAASLAARLLAGVPVLASTAAAAVSWPDAMNGWVTAAARAARAAIQRDGAEVLYTTSAPYSAHLAGLIVARQTGIPWVADFRDEWTRNPYLRRQPRALRVISEHAERAVLGRADQLLTVSDDFRFADEALAGPKRKTIPNGVDESDVSLAPSPRAGKPFTLTYVGTLYGPRDAAPVLRALSRLADCGRVDPARVRFRAVGNMWSGDTPHAGLVPSSVTGYLPHEQAVAEMAAASALLIYEPPGSRAMTGKVFEYLATGRPVLCVAPRDSAVFALVTHLAGGTCVQPDDDEGIEAAIEGLYRAWHTGKLLTDPQVRERVLASYSRRVLAGRLAAVLDELA